MNVSKRAPTYKRLSISNPPQLSCALRFSHVPRFKKVSKLGLAFGLVVSGRMPETAGWKLTLPNGKTAGKMLSRLISLTVIFS